jgi:hypothetical protein
MYDIDRGVVAIDIPVIGYETWSVAVLNENGVDKEATKELADQINSDYNPKHKHVI